jgi:fatty acid desaturase
MMPIRDPYTKHRSLLVIDEVRELSKLEPWRVVKDVFFNWSCIFAAWALVYNHPAWWTVLLAVPLIGNRFYSLFIIGHDGLHRRLFPKTDINDRFSDLLIFAPIGAITRVNKKNHLLHHRHLSNESDPDRHRHGTFNKTDEKELSLFLSGFSTLWPSVKAVFFSGSSKKANRPEHKRNLWDLAILAVWQLALFGGLTLAFGWWGYPLLWLAPVYLFTFLADNFRSFAEHSHPEADEIADEHRLITYLAPRWELELWAPKNMNYHTCHHLWPSIPYYNLPAADRLLRGRAQASDLEWRTSYLGYLKHYWNHLPLIECRKKP